LRSDVFREMIFGDAVVCMNDLTNTVQCLLEWMQNAKSGPVLLKIFKHRSIYLKSDQSIRIARDFRFPVQ
jgi:hypothetical protein